ncbi:hypothetical protein C8R44DRAFT_794305 [Mycena epipterygia]|nr:hypothetical protein C8R44DRAFT_794305 [Mycena epipterygia]
MERCVACGSLKWDDGTYINAERPANETLSNNAQFLRQRDIQLSAAIDITDAELARLNTLRRNLNALREDHRSSMSSIRRVPNEIWSSVFDIHGQLRRADLLLDSNEGMSVHLPVMLVSREWRDIAISTPALWSFIPLHMGRGFPCLPVNVAETQINLQLSRSKQHLLDIVVTASGFNSEDLIPYLSILERLFGESRRINSLVLDMRITFPILPKLSTPFENLRSLTISDTGFCIGDSDENFWNEITRAPINSLSLKTAKPKHAQFGWTQIHELRTDDVALLMTRLEFPAKSLRRVELIGYSRSGPDGQDIRRIQNSAVRSLHIHCQHSESVLVLQNLELPELQELSLKDCDHINWRENIGPNLFTFLSHTRIQSLTLNIDLSNEIGTLQHVFKSLLHLRHLNVSDFWTDGDMTPISEEHEHWFAFPLSILRSSKEPVLPVLESFAYRVFPGRFTGTTNFFSSSALVEDLGFMQFLREVDDLLNNRMNRSSKKSPIKLKKFVLQGGGRALDDFPSFLRRIEKHKKNGLVFEFDETDMDSM